MDRDRADIRIILARWGQSRSMNDAYQIDYPHCSPYCRDVRNAGDSVERVPVLSDDNHKLVDRHVSELGERAIQNEKDIRYRAICLAYICKMRDKDIAKRLECSTSRAREGRIAGENWLDARVEINLGAL